MAPEWQKPSPINSDYDETAVEKAIVSGIDAFYTQLIAGLMKIDLKDIIKRKNPYLYKAKAMATASEIVESILSNYVAHKEETLFGNEFFEPLVIAASKGVKSTSKGIDVEVRNGDSTQLASISVKSGVSVFNASSKSSQELDFNAAIKVARQARIFCQPVIGYGYGKKRSTDRENRKYISNWQDRIFGNTLQVIPIFTRRLFCL